MNSLGLFAGYSVAAVVVVVALSSVGIPILALSVTALAVLYFSSVFLNGLESNRPKPKQHGRKK